MLSQKSKIKDKNYKSKSKNFNLSLGGRGLKWGVKSPPLTPSRQGRED
jgi:hypothetical protein